VEKINPVNGIENQPLNNVQWVDREKLRPNNYNPNKVYPRELAGLKLSIKMVGWTQPIVVKPDYEIVDGFHRYTVSADKEILEMTGGKVPVVMFSKKVDKKKQMIATIQHNRFRGSHLVLKMADVVRELIDSGYSKEDLIKILQMEKDEVERLYDNSGMTVRASGDDFNKGWKPVKSKTK
jgi:ParB-like chromosome segregation protein Spo0J